MTTVACATFNALHESYARRGTLPQGVSPKWSQRQPEAQNVLGKTPLDIICMQECDEGMLRSITPASHAFVYAQHRAKPDGVGIFYNTSRFKQVAIRTVYPTNGWASVYMDLEDTTTKKIIRVASVHLQGGPERTPGDQQLITTLHRMTTESAAGISVFIVAGDFNTSRPIDDRIIGILPAYGFTSDRMPGEIPLDCLAVRGGLSSIAFTGSREIVSTLASDHPLRRHDVVFS
jgi:hypothetical protein